MGLMELISQLIDRIWGLKTQKTISFIEYAWGIKRKLEEKGYYISPCGLILDAGNGRDYDDNLGDLRIEEGAAVISPSRKNRSIEVLELKGFLEEERIPYRFGKGYHLC